MNCPKDDSKLLTVFVQSRQKNDTKHRNWLSISFVYCDECNTMYSIRLVDINHVPDSNPKPKKSDV